MLPDQGPIHCELEHAVETTLASGFGDNHSLCHGDLGNLDFVLQAGEVLSNSGWQAEALRIGETILQDIEQRGWRCGIPRRAELPGLMTGIAGIGYGILRLAQPETVPSILILEPAVK
jgi:lantibiotic modifying enzyme